MPTEYAVIKSFNNNVVLAEIKSRLVCKFLSYQ